MKNLVSKATAFEKALNELTSAEKTAGGPEKFFKQLKAINVLEVLRCLKDLGVKLEYSTKVVSSVA